MSDGTDEPRARNAPEGREEEGDVTMLVKAIQFGGCCATCEPDNDTPARGGVEVALNRDPDDIGESLCLRCASRLATLLTKAVEEVRRRQRSGEEYKWDRWDTTEGHAARGGRT